MILPINIYGDPMLRKHCEDIGPDYPNLKALIDDMFETMYHCNGVGLAAPQINKAIRLFIVDSKQIKHEDDDRKGKFEKGVKQAFINAEMIEETGPVKEFEEGCLSIPGLRGDVARPSIIKIKYLDVNFVEHVEEFDNFTARIIQHEYDHIEGELFTDKLKPLKKQLIRNRLNDMIKGKVHADYKIKFPKR